MSIKKTIALAETYGVDCVVRLNGHVQLKGDLLVNYYPESSKRTAYVAGTTCGRRNVSPEDAVKMCFKSPPMVHRRQRSKRKPGASRRQRAAMIRKGITKCCWCGCHIDIDSSTVEHVIPLARGGLDNANNRTLACLKCNNERGHDMPELSK